MMKDEFVQEIEAFLKAHKVAPSAFGRAAVNDRSFVADLKAGKRDVKMSTVEKVRKYMKDYEKGHAVA